MKSYSTFLFDSYSLDTQTGVISLKYSLDDEIEFIETITIPTKDINIQDAASLEKALQTLHLIGGISYFKTCCPKKIEVRSVELNDDQAAFWNTVYEKGLGEFFYQNKMKPTGNIHFEGKTESSTPSSSFDPSMPQSKITPDNERGNALEEEKKLRTLVPIGGGKDSIVTVEMLREAGADITLFRMGKHPLIDAMIAVMKLPCITAKRSLSTNLFALHEGGALNGHVPVTAYLSTLCTVIAELYGFNHIAMSNEESANEGNVKYQNVFINHQWSKSEEFEILFQKYIQKYIDPSLTYVSHLRELNELQIAQKFVEYPEYFSCFSSCNRNWKITGGINDQESPWCGECPKCAFSFVLFSAFLSKKQLEKIFHKNLYEEERLIPLFKQLLGIEGFKPFECVGTAKETQEAFSRAYHSGEWNTSPVMKMFLEHFPIA